MRDEPSLVQLILHLEQWIISKAWLGYNNLRVAKTATIAGTPRSNANCIWYSWTSLGATDKVVVFRCIRKAPKLATPQPMSNATRVLTPNVIPGTIYKIFNLKISTEKADEVIMKKAEGLNETWEIWSRYWSAPWMNWVPPPGKTNLSFSLLIQFWPPLSSTKRVWGTLLNHI